MSINMKTKIVERVVTKALNDIAAGGSLFIRRLVSLGAHFSKNDYSRYLFDLIESLLSDPRSNYYQLVNNIIMNTDRNCLQTFAINLGYHALVAGAETLRLQSPAGGGHTRWYCPLPETSDQLDDFLSLQEARGVRFFYRDIAPADVGELLPFCRRHPQCDFLLFADQAEISRLNPGQLLSAANLLISLPADDADFSTASELLAAARCHFGAYLNYHRGNYQDIMRNAWQELLRSAAVPYLLLRPAAEIDEATAVEIYRYAKQYRFDPRASVFLVDFPDDLHYIDEALSGELIIPTLCLAEVTGE